MYMLTMCLLDAGSSGRTGSGTLGSGGSGGNVSKATKGAEYDATGGAVDDRSGMQKIKDKLTPGSSVGKHTNA